MDNNMSFADILKKKLDQFSPSESETEYNLKSQDFPHFTSPTPSYIFFDHPPKKATFSKEKVLKYTQFRPTPQNSKVSPEENETISPSKTTNCAPKEWTFSPQQLSESGRIHLKKLRDLGGLDLYKNNLALKDLKSTYKALTLRLHPDLKSHLSQRDLRPWSQKFAQMRDSFKELHQEALRLKKEKVAKKAA